MPNDPDELQDAHNDGQADGSNNEYDPPVPIGPLDELLHSEETLNEWRELNQKYDEGWDHGNKQR